MALSTAQQVELYVSFIRSSLLHTTLYLHVIPLLLADAVLVVIVVVYLMRCRSE
jgi:hypothetical protein